MYDGNTISAAYLALDQQGASFSYPSVTALGGEWTRAGAPVDSQTQGSAGLIDPGLLDSDLKQREFEVILSTLRKNKGKRVLIVLPRQLRCYASISDAISIPSSRMRAIL